MRPKRRRPPEDYRPTTEDVRTPSRPGREVPAPEDYVDFQPVDYPTVSPAPEEEDEDKPRGSEY